MIYVTGRLVMLIGAGAVALVCGSAEVGWPSAAGLAATSSEGVASNAGAVRSTPADVIAESAVDDGAVAGLVLAKNSGKAERKARQRERRRERRAKQKDKDRAADEAEDAEPHQ